MPRKLRKLRITEISACDVGAGEGVRIVLAKRHDGFMEVEMEQITKRMNDRADEIIKVDGKLSHDQAIAKIATSSRKEDRELWAAYKANATVPPPAAAPAPPATSPAYAKLVRKAEKALRKQPDLGTMERAFAKVYSDPQYTELVMEEKREFFAKADLQSSARRPSAIALEALIIAIMASHPKLSKQEAQRWAKLTMEHRPPDVQRLVNYEL